MSRPFSHPGGTRERGTREKSVAKIPIFSTSGFLATDSSFRGASIRNDNSSLLGLSLIAEAVTLNAVKGLFKNFCYRIDPSGYPLGGRACVQGDKRKS